MIEPPHDRRKYGDTFFQDCTFWLTIITMVAILGAAIGILSSFGGTNV